jgi:hypothetical protein
MARGKQTLKGIYEAISRLEAERAAFNSRIDGRIEGLKEALRIQNGEFGLPTPENRQRRMRRGNLKETVLDLAAQVAEVGMTGEECVALAKSKGIDLVPASVSSLLSRLKTDGILFFDGQKYRLKQYSGPKQAA